MALAASTLIDAGAWAGVHAAALLQAAVQAAPALPDTIVTKQAPIDPGWFERFQETLRALMTLAILVLTVAVVPAAWNFRKSYQKVSDLLDKVYADVNPIAHHAGRIVENVDYVSTAIRADTERASALIHDAERRLRGALDRAEARARDLEALFAVAQGEAEASLVTAASTVAGVREGVASLRADLLDAARGAASPRPAPSPALRAPDYLDETPDLLADDVALVDARPESSAGAAPFVRSGPPDVPADPRPRVRPRRPE